MAWYLAIAVTLLVIAIGSFVYLSKHPLMAISYPLWIQRDQRGQVRTFSIN